MQYAAASPIPTSQFASLSLILSIPKNNSDESSGSITTTRHHHHHPLPFLVVAPTCSCTSYMAIAAVGEVQDHIQTVLCSSIIKNDDDEAELNNDYATQLLQEEAQSIFGTTTTGTANVQIYRPLSTNGMAIHYRFMDGRSTGSTTTSSSNSNNNGKANTNPDAIMVSKLQSLLLSSVSNHKIDLSGKVLGVLLCVAATGGSTIFSSSSLSYTLCQRMNDCISHLQQQSSNTIRDTKELLTFYLLMDDELKINNSVIQPTTDYIQFPSVKGGGRGGATGGGTFTSPLGRIATPIAEFGIKAARRASTGIVRGVMNVGQNHPTPTAAMNAQPQAIPVETGFPLPVRPNSAVSSRSLMDQLTILSVTEHSTFLRKYEHSGQERKANLDLTGGTNKSRFRRRRTTDTMRDADFDHFDYKGPPQQSATATMLSNTEASKGISTITTAASTISSATMNSPIQNPPGKLLQFKSSAKDTKRGPSSRRPTAAHQTGATPNGDGMPSSQQPKQSMSGSKLSDRIDHASNSSSMSNNKRMLTNNNTTTTTKTENDDLTYDSRSQQSSTGQYPPNPHPSASPSLGKLHINIALNEDLSCSYKLSQLSSCSVDGIVQVQVKSSVPIAKSQGGIPFVLVLKDPMVHIDSLNENPKYATKTTSYSNNNSSSSFHNDCFNVIIPEQEKYFSLLKYRCKDDLRPVPIRVQAKVKADGTYCRVALQISSNPNNESKLTDLTITMGVPMNVVYGASLVTQPAGGVYDASKSSVIWCVSELGCGEKFQLQARFDMKPDAAGMKDDELNFPVLVRCQCLHVQLSGVGFEVRNQPSDARNRNEASSLPTDMIMKIASRFRLSHRERNS